LEYIAMKSDQVMYGSTMFDTKSLNDKEDMYCVEHEQIEI